MTRLCFALAAISLVASAAHAQTSTEMVPMRDGVALATDVYLPAAGTGFAVILIRTPYDKSGVSEIGTNLATAGVAAVVQDTRGRFASEGVDCIFRCEQGDGLEDGHDTMAWIAAQDWYGGPIVTYGGSALGIVQYLQAVDASDELGAMWVEVGTPTLYSHGISQGGVFRQAMMEGWLMAQGSAFFLDDVAAHPTRDAFWDALEVGDRWDHVNVPAVHWGGWYDIFGQGTIDAFVGYQHHGGPDAQGAQKLVMGPWVHGGWGRATQGELTYPAEALTAPEPNMGLRWLAHYTGVTPDDTWIASLPAVTYYVMGDVDDTSAPGNEWRTAADWPIPAAPTRWYLQPGGVLEERCPPADGGDTSYAYDSADPAPTLGGANLVLPAGPYDQRPVEARDDVIVFSSAPLEAPVEITGRVRAHLFVTPDVVDTDVMVRLTDVYPDGRSMLVLDGAQRLALREDPARVALLTPGETVEVDVDLWSTSIAIAAGHVIRISISSANAPRFFASRNDGSSYGEDGSPVVAHVSVLHADEQASYVELPMPGRDEATVVTCGPTAAPDAGAADLDAGTGPVETPKDDGGCGCSVPGDRAPPGPSLVLLALGLAAGLRRRSRVLLR